MLVSNESTKFPHLCNQEMEGTTVETKFTMFPFGNVSTTLWLVLILFVFYNVLPSYFVSKRIWSMRGSMDMSWRLLEACFQGNVGMFKLTSTFLAKVEKPTLWNAFGIKILYVPKPEDIQIVLNKPQSMNKSVFYKLFFDNIFGEGLVTASGDRWKIQRRVMTPAFSTNWIQNFMDVFNNRSALLVRKLQSNCDTGEETDIWDPLMMTAMAITFDTTLGTVNGITEKEIEYFAHAMLETGKLDIIRIGRIYLYPNFMYNFYIRIYGYSKYIDYIRDLPLKIIKKKRQSRDDNNDDPLKGKTFIDVLLKANEEETVLTDKEILDEVMTILPAASETSATTGCFLLMMLAMNSEIQEKLYQEIIGVLGHEREYMTIADLDRMTFLEQCLNETLRLFPVLPFIMRRASSDFELSNGFVVPRHSQIMISTFNLHRDPKIYENPLVWNPNNFTSEKIKSRHKFAYLPFSGGPKQCIGMRYANVVLKMTMAAIVRKYRVTTDVKLEDIVFYYDIILRSVNGYKIRLHSRQETNS